MPSNDRPAVAIADQRRSQRRLLLAAGLLPVSASACAKKPCANTTVGESDQIARVQVGSHRVKPIAPSFFGFNFEVFDVQRSFWNETDHAPLTQPLELMRAFPGAVYRFPGGTIANHYDWRAGVGEHARRPAYRIADWHGPWQNSMGLAEYLAWVRAVDGEVWYVLNLFGRFRDERGLEGLKDDARELVSALRRLDPKPDQGVLRWELGNELDRDVYEWRPDKYIARARAIGGALRQADPQAPIVLMMQDYPALEAKAGISVKDYNSQILRSLGDLSIEYSRHLYYDDPPNGPYLPVIIDWLCDSVTLLDQASAAQDASIWITEHARWPGEVKGQSWESQWFKTANLAAAISVADLMIAITQMRRIRSGFVHSIHGSPGPWPLLHQLDDGQFVGSAVYLGLRVLREHLLDQVLATETLSTRLSAYPGGYDVRASMMTSADGRRHALWAINRYARPVTIELTLPALAGRRLDLDRSFISGPTPERDNYRGQVIDIQRDQVSATFDASGMTRLSLPGNAVVGLSTR